MLYVGSVAIYLRAHCCILTIISPQRRHLASKPVMKVQLLSRMLFLLSLLGWQACQTPSVPPPPAEQTPPAPVSAPVAAAPATPVDWLVVGNDGSMLLFGKSVQLETLQSALLDSLVKMKEVPSEIPIKFGEEILMGMRGEVRTEVQDALEKAGKKKQNPKK